MPTYRHFLPDLIEIQRQSFFYLLEKGIIEEFSKRNPITDLKKDIEIFFYPEYYQLTKPKYTVNQAILKNRSYTSKLYIPVQLTDRKRKCIYLKWIFLANVPLITNRGHFLLNGSARVIVNQIVRSPGVYFQQKLREIYLTKWDENPAYILKRYYADLICLRGTWLRIEIDKQRRIWAKMKKVEKIPMIWLLIGMGLSEKMIFSSIESSYRLRYNFTRAKSSEKQYSYVQNALEAWEKIYDLMGLSKNRLNSNKSPYDVGRSWLFKKFMNPRTYDLGKQGRVAINQKLGLTISPTQTTLTVQDLLNITDFLLKVERGFYKTDDIDHLKNRRVRCSGDLIQAQFAVGLIRLEKFIRDQLAETTTLRLNRLITTKPLNGALKEFFGTNPLSQFMDQMNPLAEITHKRRLSSMGPGGITRDNATLAIRGIHSSHYGRICPIETPEGKNTGLVNSLTTYSKVNHQGLIITPFFKVFKGQVQKDLGMIYLTADQEETTTVAAGDIFVSKLGFLPKISMPVRTRAEFATTIRKNIHFLAISPIQMISVATSLIPFLEHDDANRALMGSNMQRQAVPLIRAEKPLVGTGLEARSVSDSGHVLIAKSSGYVTYVSGSTIRLYCFNN